MATHIREKKSNLHHVWMGGPKHGDRLTSAQRRRIIDKLVELDGPICRATVCLLGKREEDLETRPHDARYHIFTIDHLNGAANHYLDWMQLAHSACNSAEKRPAAPREVGTLHESEREKIAAVELHEQTLAVNVAKAENLPTVLAINYDHETEYRKYYLNAVREAAAAKQEVSRKHLRPNARERSGSSCASAYSYEERLFADKEGPLIEQRDGYSKKLYITFRHAADRNLSLDELMKKYPKEGKSSLERDTTEK